MTAWQVQLHFDPAVLTWISGGSLEGDYVFAYHLGSDKFTGNCTLLQITFKGKTVGISSLHFSETMTKLYSDGVKTPFNTADGIAKVAHPEIVLTKITPYKTIVSQGYSTHINVTIENQGGPTENFNVTTYANTTIIDTLTNVTLTSENSITLTFTWNTTGFAKGNYTISAYAWPVPDEINTTNNNFTDGWVIVAMPGDITSPDGWPDGLVDIDDVMPIALAFGAIQGQDSYNPNYDFNNDGLIDIDDVLVPALRFGEIDP
jgi:CARDB.